MKKKDYLRYLPLVMMGAGVLIVSVLLLTGRFTVRQALFYTQSRPLLCAAVLLALYLIKGFSVVIPYSVLAAAAGLVFPLPWAIGLNSVGTILCLCVSYFIGRFTKNETFERRLARAPKLQRFFLTARSYGFGFSYVLHVLGLSTEVLGVLLGMLRLPLWQYLLSSFLAMSPGMACCTIVGSNLDFRSPVFWGILCCDLIVIAACWIYTRKRMKE